VHISWEWVPVEVGFTGGDEGAGEEGLGEPPLVQYALVRVCFSEFFSATVAHFPHSGRAPSRMRHSRILLPPPDAELPTPCHGMRGVEGTQGG
jgi:hypothetical protein